MYTDRLGKLTQVVTDVNYAPNSTIESIRYGNGVIKYTERDREYNYRLRGSSAIESNGLKILDTQYSYDGIGNIVGISEGGIEPLRKNISYTYDPLKRLTNAQYSYTLS